MDETFEILKYTHDKHPESHIHEYYEIFISLSNEGKFFVKEAGYPLRLGTVFFLPPFEIHRCFCRGSQDYDRYVIHFYREQLEALSTERTNLTEIFDSAPLLLQLQDDKLAKLLGKLAFLNHPPDSSFASDVDRKLKFENFLLEIGRIIYNSGAVPMPMEDDNRLINNILKYIHMHYSEDIYLDELAKTFFLSKSRLCQVFKESTGFSVGDYIITYRIKRACALLQAGYTVQEAGQKVGFHTNTHFIRMFKMHTGSSPGQFAKKQ